jgi:ABC-type polysaccharide/polyol phosphate export permease
VSFGVFLITGLVPFLALSDAVVRAARVFRSNVSLVQRVRLPAEVLVLGDVLGTLLHHALSFIVVVMICLWAGHMTLAGLPWVVLAVGLFAIWIVGLALIASVLGAFLPDVPEVLTLGFQVMFYGAPIVYPLSMVGADALRSLIQLNPLTPMLGVVRAGLLSAAPPPPVAVLGLVAVGALLVVVGSVALDRWRFNIPDLL